MIRDDIVIILNGLLKEDKERVLHISLNIKRFYNGVVLNIGEDSLTLKDSVLGEITIPFNMIVNIEPKVDRR